MFQAKANNKVGEIFLYGDIGDFFFDGITPTSVNNALNDMKAVDELHVHINSPGGSVFDGIAIYNRLHQFKAKKIVHVDGLAASIASYIAMVAEDRRMPKNAMMMIHKAWTFTAGNADELEENARNLRLIDQTLLDTYVAKTGMDAAELEKMLASETWMKAELALKHGFVNTIEDTDSKAQAVDQTSRVLDKFKNAPTSLVDRSSRTKLAKMNKWHLQHRSKNA
jgi:ATP-dependent Clp protease protease subunit